MANRFLIAPDFSPERFAGWHLLNNLLQKRANLAIHLNTPASHAEQEELIESGDIKIVYANPFDAAKMIREQGYRAIVRPVGKSNEMVVTSSVNSDIKTLDDVKAGMTIAMANNRDVKLIGMRLLEAVDLTENDVKFEIVDTYQAAARLLIQDKAQVAFFIAEVFAGLSNLTKSQLNILIQSDIATLTHVVLVKDDFADAEKLQEVLLSLDKDDDGKAVLKELGLESGFEVMSEEDAEFMIDLMETLLD
ncbi:PhnD/SsuA/transferrin family substrate-binding protein [Moraxella oblonga]|uniref:PhnD/SsuA/transferrin family substrate-binding protein n=1 Tax=Moraxella oblonga TaxID=200413 RepID=UPI00082D5720|nr:PhnD/SsuA/transferrin family substrate-binding protein [Moraxella oblonga]